MSAERREESDIESIFTDACGCRIRRVVRLGRTGLGMEIMGRVRALHRLWVHLHGDQVKHYCAFCDPEREHPMSKRQRTNHTNECTQEKPRPKLKPLPRRACSDSRTSLPLRTAVGVLAVLIFCGVTGPCSEIRNCDGRHRQEAIRGAQCAAGSHLFILAGRPCSGDPAGCLLSSSCLSLRTESATDCADRISQSPCWANAPTWGIHSQSGGSIPRFPFSLRTRPHRTFAACRALSRRCSAVRRFARDVPPLRPSRTALWSRSAGGFFFATPTLEGRTGRVTMTAVTRGSDMVNYA